MKKYKITPEHGTVRVYRILNQRYKEGDVVETDDGTIGVVSEVRKEGEFEGPDGETYEPTSDSPVYIVATESDDQPSIAVRASDLQSSELPEVDVENPEEDLAEVAENSLTGNQTPGFFEWPESWVESETPARIIALKAWAGMGGRHGGGSAGGCTSTMRGKIAAPDRFCADLKDRILGWEGWRRGG